MPHESSDTASIQMRKGIIEFCTLLIIKRGRVYASDILQALKQADLLVVEGTLYPLLSRMRANGLLTHEWEESKSGPPRKYYTLTEHGTATLKQLQSIWHTITTSVTTLQK